MAFACAEGSTQAASESGAANLLGEEGMPHAQSGPTHADGGEAGHPDAQRKMMRGKVCSDMQCAGPA